MVVASDHALSGAGMTGLGFLFAAIGCLLVPSRARPGPQREQVISHAHRAYLAEDVACAVRAGLPVATALSLAAVHVPESIAQQARAVASALSMGIAPELAWHGTSFADLATIHTRSTATGSSFAAELTDYAADLRDQAVAQLTTRAERAGVLIVAPLGLCFLPAFLCLGIAPTILGLLSRLSPIFS
jgi:hypothetical protein